MVRHFQEPAPSSEPHSSSGEAIATAREKVSRNSEQMDVDSDSQLSSKKAEEDNDEMTNPAPETATNQQNIYHNASGLRLTKYNAVLVDIMPNFKTLSREARIAVKRGVKLFLQQGMGDRFRECMFTLEGAEHHTYGVPDEMLAEFRDWAVEGLGRCFPDKLGRNE
ncbi:hypothetical protein HDU78_002843 [Chytriomyces hyalinus]|nr:hypothetical protein HDU78_002843 [Chytriomyces hyalinus]